MKVTTSCSGRFHIYDQAHELNRHGILHKLISDYPRFISQRWGIPDEKTITLLSHGIKARLGRKLSTYLNEEFESKLARKLHNDFATRVAKKIPIDSDVFIGLSSLSLAAIRKAKNLGIVTIVDHGSVHLNYDYNMLHAEALHWGIRPTELKNIKWAIEQENDEFREANYVFTLSKFAKKTLIESGVDPQKIFTNQCGVDLKSFNPGRKIDNTFRIIQVGHVCLRKGSLYTLKAFNELNLPNSELIFVGSIDSNSDFRKVLNKYSNDKTRFIGPISQHQLSKIYQQSSIAVLPSVSDGFGMVVTQSMACGLPTIVSNHVGAMDIITSGENGLIFQNGNLNELEEKILSLYQDSEERKNMGFNAFKSMSSQNGWRGYGDRLAQFLTKVVN